jgi:UDP-N-acetylglucosamine:LPS N-acetylglucosamine transferase
VVGSPRLDELPARKWDGVTTVAVSFHWDCRVAQESASAFPDFKDSLAQLGRWRVIGHGHPRAMAQLRPFYEAQGIEVVEDFDEVCRRADLYVCDNSSTLFEFASTGRPVVVLNAGLYRKSVHHGLRFWDAANVGIQVDDPSMLGLAAEYALSDPSAQREAREHSLSIAYTYRTGAAARAARVLEDWLT